MEELLGVGKRESIGNPSRQAGGLTKEAWQRQGLGARGGCRGWYDVQLGLT